MILTSPVIQDIEVEHEIIGISLSQNGDNILMSEDQLKQFMSAELATIREAGEKMAKIYTHLPKEIRNESNVYYQILLSGVEAMELMTALEAWEAANK